MTDNAQMLSGPHREWYREKLAQAKEGPASTGFGLPIAQKMRFVLVRDHLLVPSKLEAPAILDVGCGTGDLLRYLYDEDRLPYSYLGLDLMPEMIRAAKGRDWPEECANRAFWATHDVREMQDRGDWHFAVSLATFALKWPGWSMAESLRAVQESFEAMVGQCQVAALITLFSPWKNQLQPDEMVVDPMVMWGWARQRWERVDLIASYAPYDYALVVWKGESEWRKAWNAQTVV